MATLQKRTSDLLKAQKASYPKMVKSALKGKTGLSRAEVNKTIRGVAKDYREQYGSTPRKRYLNAVKQAASTMPKATKTAKPNAAAKPKAKAAPKATPKIKTEAQKYLEEQGKKNVQRIQRRNERIRHRTEAAIANHKAEQAFNEAPTSLFKRNSDKLTHISIWSGIGTGKLLFAMLSCCSPADKVNPETCGVYFDSKENCVVATDRQILVVYNGSHRIKQEYKGKIVFPSGELREMKYPNWRYVTSYMPVNNHLGKLRNDFPTKQIPFTSSKKIDVCKIGEAYYKKEHLQKAIRILKESGVDWKRAEMYGANSKYTNLLIKYKSFTTDIQIIILAVLV